MAVVGAAKGVERAARRWETARRRERIRRTTRYSAARSRGFRATWTSTTGKERKLARIRTKCEISLPAQETRQVARPTVNKVLSVVFFVGGTSLQFSLLDKFQRSRSYLHT